MEWRVSPALRFCLFYFLFLGLMGSNCLQKPVFASVSRFNRSRPPIAFFIHDDAAKLGFNQETRWMTVFARNSSELGRYHTATGPAIINGMPRAAGLVKGWPKLENYARRNFGTGDYRLVTNPSENPSSHATSCISDGITQFYVSGSPVCTINEAVTGGTLVGTGGVVTLGFTSGYSSNASYSVTMGEEGLPITAEVMFTNEIGSQFSTNTSNTMQQSISLNALANSMCILHTKPAIKFQLADRVCGIRVGARPGAVKNRQLEGLYTRLYSPKHPGSIQAVACAADAQHMRPAVNGPGHAGTKSRGHSPWIPACRGIQPGVQPAARPSGCSVLTAPGLAPGVTIGPQILIMFLTHLREAPMWNSLERLMQTQRVITQENALVLVFDMSKMPKGYTKSQPQIDKNID
ncbi:hypothetical protein B0H10DRAFT_1949645 [Mycena sp. CBHHK59/15]|nr:hypothetical protein B0H10DRAFT_1949645 [Mycena sp. CBHHK59/15]